MIVTPQSRATKAGYDVLAHGGNAVDAAVTAGFVQGVVAPETSSLGGWGVMLIHLAESNRQVVVSFHGRSGSLVQEGQWLPIYQRRSKDRNRFLIAGNANDVGYQSVTVPGTVRGLAVALQEFGTMSWGSVLTSAIRHAREGFVVSPAMRAAWMAPPNEGGPTRLQRLQTTTECARIYTDNGRPYNVGDRVVLSDYASTLSRLAKDGPDDFYSGEIARQISDDFRANGGYLTRDDLINYRVTVEPPLRGTYRGYEIVTVPPPACGMSLIQMLNFLEGFDSALLRQRGPEWAECLVEALRWAFHARDRYLGDPGFGTVPLEVLLSKAHAVEARREFLDGRRSEIGDPQNSPGTTHVSVTDARGNAVSLTHSLGVNSGVVTPGLGFIYNNCMALFDPRPGHPNSLAPGKARAAMVAPTIIFREGKPVSVVGAPGGTRIVGAVLHSIINTLDGRMDASAAVSAPRVDCQGDLVEAEGGIPEDLVETLRSRTYKVHHQVEKRSPYFASAQMIRVSDDGAVSGASDPRSADGLALATK